MSDCKHQKRTNYRTCYEYVCYCIVCEADITSFELEALERAEKAEARADTISSRIQGVNDALLVAEARVEELERINRNPLEEVERLEARVKELEGTGK
tara:strand:+ start:328 stop:621 length:294 start_codon:yes stop_codon:yes gene_type:complete